MSELKKKRILLVDDNIEIHHDFLKILSKSKSGQSEEDDAILFGMVKTRNNFKSQEYSIDSAYQGEEALELVKKAFRAKEPYAVAFIDMRMPPGWDGVETIKQIWKVDPCIQMVICSAYSDHSWLDITQELGNSDNLLILKKPFEVIEINQLASALTKKWELIANLHGLVQERTAELEHLYSLSHATLESTQEGILAVGLDGSIVTYNQNFLKQWNVPAELLKTEKALVIFEKLAEQTSDPGLFVQMMRDLMINHQTVYIKEWPLNTGAILELYTQRQYLHDVVIGIVYSFQVITERKELERQLLHQATHDTLTGLPNRALLLDRIKQALAHANRFNLHVGVLLVDIDFFKEVNDTLGHKAGDLLLQAVAARLTDLVRESDTVARLGGDEFVVILVAQADESNFLAMLDTLIKQLSKPCQLGDHEIMVTSSIGVSIYPRDGDNADILLKNADAALYHAKDLGRNRFQFYMEEFNQQILQRSELKIALGQALQRNEFYLNYQPLIDLKSNRIIGMEALLRWQHPTHGIISPLKFIGLAEETGLIVSIGEWVLRTACKQATFWHKHSAFPDLKISVNISVKQFRQKDFVDLICTILKDTKLKPSCLELEITESLILGNITDVVQKMIELKTLGVRFAIDDFGTGYSGLSYLRHFPFDTVKIDKSFMDNITIDSNNASIVEAIIAMTKNMGIDVLAEGVEHLDQVDFLRQHHNNLVQGYYYSVPLDVKDCTDLLKKDIEIKTQF